MFKTPRYERISMSTWACRDVNDIYERITRVGSGTYGEVDKACLKSNREKIVALKKIKDENETEGFPITALREINILQSLDHPNIVKLIEVVTSKASEDSKKKRGSTYLVFEYMEHELLGLIDRIKFEPAQIKCIMKQILEGLNYLYDKNILHRDIKSANILLNNKGEVKLADFGLAKKITNAGNLTPRVVTRWYRAPELLLGSRGYTTKIDIWAAGCVFAELLLGVSEAIFPAQNTPSQFDVICAKCGVPDDESWPGYKSLGHYANMMPKKNHRRMLIEYMRKKNSNIDETALDLLDKMLTLNPDIRIDAKEALQHPYFTTAPLPCELSEMPKIEKEHHDYILKAERKQQQLFQNANAQMAANQAPNKQGQLKYGGQQNLPNKYMPQQQYQNHPNITGGPGANRPQNSQYHIIKNQANFDYSRSTKIENFSQMNIKLENPNQPNSHFSYSEIMTNSHQENNSHLAQNKSEKQVSQQQKNQNLQSNKTQQKYLATESNPKNTSIASIANNNNNNTNINQPANSSKKVRVKEETQPKHINESTHNPSNQLKKEESSQRKNSQSKQNVDTLGLFFGIDDDNDKKSTNTSENSSNTSNHQSGLHTLLSSQKNPINHHDENNNNKLSITKRKASNDLAEYDKITKKKMIAAAAVLPSS